MVGVNLGRPDAVTRLFDEAAPDYDAVSALMAFGSGGMVPAQRARAREARRIVGRAGAVTGIDASAGMLARATRALPGALAQHIFSEYTARKPRLDSVCLLAQPLDAAVPDIPTTRRG